MKRFSKQDLATLEFCLRKLPRIALAAAVGIAMMLPPVLRVAHAQGGASPALAAPPNFSLVGLALNQSLRINVVAPTVQPGFPPNPCSAALSFLDATGNPVGPTRSLNLNAGQSASLDLNGNALPQRFGQRAEVRPIAITYPPSPCIVSAEVFDNFTAFSTLVVPVTSVLVAPGPNEVAPGPPNFGVQGLALGQVLRLNVAAYPPNPAYPPDPCVASLGFADRNGNAVGPVTTVGLNPGQSASLDLNSSTVITKLGTSSFALFGQRVEVRPVVTLVPTSAVNACQASAEVFDTFTGRTWSYAVPPGPNE
jgi:hypothetical protein